MATAGSKSNPIRRSTRTVKAESVAPNSLTLAYKNGTATLTWKRGADYTSQNVHFRRYVGEWKDWSAVSVTASATSASKAYPLSDYYPNTSRKLGAIRAEVRGLQADYTIKSAAYKENGKYYYDEVHFDRKWSDYVPIKFDVKPPAKPSLGTASSARGAVTTTSFPYNVDLTTDPCRIFTRVQYDTALVANWGDQNPANYKGAWTSAGTNGSASSTATITEPASIHGLANGASYTRLIRMRAQGPQGDSGYAYNKFVYAWPYKISTSNIAVTLTIPSSNVMRVAVSWTPNKDSKHPVASYKVNYYIGKPKNGSMAMPSGSISWNPGDSGTTNTSTSFNIPQTLQKDEALWVQVVQVSADGYHETPSDAKYVAFGGVSSIASDPTVSYDSEGHQLTIGCTNPVDSAIESSTIKITLWKYSNGWKKVGTHTIPHGGSSVTITQNMTDADKWQIDANADIGNGYLSATRSLTYYPKESATDIHAYRPTNVKVSAVQGSAGYADVTWINTIPNSTKSRVAISEDWNVTSPTFVVDIEAGAGATSARVSGLEYNTQYYAGVKSFRDSAESDWSEIYPFRIDASAAPVPILSAKETVVGRDHFITVTWDWSRWAQADALELFWADNPSLLETEFSASSETIKKVSGAGETTFPIMKDIERGKTYYIQARFLSGAAETNMSKTVSVELPVVPVAPTNITAVREAQATDESGKSTVRVSWDLNWDDADSAVIAWADSESAWEATSGLQTYTLSGAQGRNTTVLIPNLQMGKTWYFKVNLTYNSGAFETSYSSVPFTPLDLTTDPDKPVASLSAPVISELSKTDISWNYSCEDGMAQTSVEMLVTDENGDEVVSIGYGGTETSFALYPETYGMVGNHAYSISVRTTSASGRFSEWSEPVTLNVVHKPIAEIASTSLNDGVLTELPFTVTVSGLNGTGTTTVYIERAQECFEPSPDEDQRGGYEGELIALVEAQDTGTVSITADDLRGLLNDSAPFRIVAMVSDSLGTSDPVTQDFTVSWSHQAIMPIVTREVDDDARIVKMTITAPEEAVEGDTVDIYRLSADKPELIVQGAVFGETYVDPYPAFGFNGGHRFVFRTLNNDITTEDKRLAWIDLDGSCDATDPEAETDAIIPADRTTINWSNNQIDLFYNLELSHSWEKDFSETKYLGGSVQGDWNPAVSRKASVSSVSIALTDQDTINKMRRLAVYPGICHVRTPDGSSFPADVQVSEDRSHSTAGKIVSFSLDITRVDAETLDGMTLAEWEAGDELE